MYITYKQVEYKILHSIMSPIFAQHSFYVYLSGIYFQGISNQQLINTFIEKNQVLISKKTFLYIYFILSK